MKAIQVKSNLNYIQDMELDLDIVDKKQVSISFSTGFKTTCAFVETKKDVDIYCFRSKYSDEIHYLHLRREGNVIYGQTVQTGLEAGGCTFKIIDDTFNTKPSIIEPNNWYLTTKGHIVFITDEKYASNNGNAMHRASLLIKKGSKEPTSNFDTIHKYYSIHELKKKTCVNDLVSDFLILMKSSNLI
jgi:hypothetical protein